MPLSTRKAVAVAGKRVASPRGVAPAQWKSADIGRDDLVIQGAISSMWLNARDVKVHIEALQTLVDLVSTHKFLATDVLKHEAAPAVLRALQRFMQSKEVQGLGLRLMGLLAEFGDGSCDLTRLVRDDDDYSSSSSDTADVASEDPEHSPVYTYHNSLMIAKKNFGRSNAFLEDISEDSQRLSTSSSRSSSSKGGVTLDGEGEGLMLSAVRYHSHNIHVLASAFYVTSIMLERQPEIVEESVRDTMVLIMLKAMDKARFSDELQADGCRLLLVTLPECVLRGADLHALEGVFLALKLHHHCVQVQLHGWKLLAKAGWTAVSHLGSIPLLELLSEAIFMHREDEVFPAVAGPILMHWIDQEKQCHHHHRKTDMEWLEHLGYIANMASYGNEVIEKLADQFFDEAYCYALSMHDNGAQATAMLSKHSFYYASALRFQKAHDMALHITQMDGEWATGWLRLGQALIGLRCGEEALAALTWALKLEASREKKQEIQISIQKALELMASSYGKADVKAH
eukprot:CAMPEP_0170593982 /NCGR_PEP_ID=MMETSP0224-20130122/13750_1 /TAXON_ID=285029 /ORGANISM="Togula jolla, Strain CCCM 725" /LENGTH=513 /DNA_ID=CAMNT_0010917995 /DNA_START=18 /DNA_END=1559 /DNA_ORIENTATION=-